ncbi:hypothetical protein GUITHDRAFT_143392 [Guillardia theta CCMP2712]|uniref:Uncharacterized protein n=1 Tax=Guillardia theta (strain CCMP2712) TaxID=905079 RepID=L1IUU8_GUITC|nr:hypothetical protein GUITHDRAFT_143392 [Guillardia theta CCMP2712]EKX39615.1 hypothetical protein GUITHDRAFT_143392 [Guillardia theta CCMP2712]|eukprot:XP_005826595.1 hypothetical protein GUITHDRAFT_143392 [Guillardia theta CCMP2712]
MLADTPGSILETCRRSDQGAVEDEACGESLSELEDDDLFRGADVFKFRFQPPAGHGERDVDCRSLKSMHQDMRRLLKLAISGVSTMVESVSSACKLVERHCSVEGRSDENKLSLLEMSGELTDLRKHVPIAQGGSLGISILEVMCKTARVKNNLADEQSFVLPRMLQLQTSLFLLEGDVEMSGYHVAKEDCYLADLEEVEGGDVDVYGCWKTENEGKGRAGVETCHERGQRNEAVRHVPLVYQQDKSSKQTGQVVAVLSHYCIQHFFAETASGCQSEQMHR